MFSDEDIAFVELLASMDKEQLNMVKGFAIALVANQFDDLHKENPHGTMKQVREEMKYED